MSARCVDWKRYMYNGGKNDSPLQQVNSLPRIPRARKLADELLDLVSEGRDEGRHAKNSEREKGVGAGDTKPHSPSNTSSTVRRATSPCRGDPGPKDSTTASSGVSPCRNGATGHSFSEGGRKPGGGEEREEDRSRKNSDACGDAVSLNCVRTDADKAGTSSSLQDRRPLRGDGWLSTRERREKDSTNVGDETNTATVAPLSSSHVKKSGGVSTGDAADVSLSRGGNGQQKNESAKDSNREKSHRGSSSHPTDEGASLVSSGLPTSGRLASLHCLSFTSSAGAWDSKPGGWLSKQRFSSLSPISSDKRRQQADVHELQEVRDTRGEVVDVHRVARATKEVKVEAESEYKTKGVLRETEVDRGVHPSSSPSRRTESPRRTSRKDGKKTPSSSSKKTRGKRRRLVRARSPASSTEDEAPSRKSKNASHPEKKAKNLRVGERPHQSRDARSGEATTEDSSKSGEGFKPVNGGVHVAVGGAGSSAPPSSCSMSSSARSSEEASSLSEEDSDEEDALDALQECFKESEEMTSRLVHALGGKDPSSRADVAKKIGGGRCHPDKSYALPHDLQNGQTGVARLKEYQRCGVHWLITLHKANRNGILADEMGLGKTAQTCVFLNYLYQSGRVTAPTIVVAPASLLDNWVKELEDWAPFLAPDRVMKYHGKQAERREMAFQFLNSLETDDRYLVMVTSLNTLTSKWDMQYLRQIRPVAYLVVDEAHSLKNRDSLVYKKLNKTLKCDRRLLLTGSPIQNRTAELRNLLLFLMPSVFEGDSLDLALQAFYRQTRRQRAAEHRHQRRLAAAAASGAEGVAAVSTGPTPSITCDATGSDSSSEEAKCQPSAPTATLGEAERKDAEAGTSVQEDCNSEHPRSGTSKGEGEYVDKSGEHEEANKSSLLDAIVQGDNNGIVKLHISGKAGAKEEDEAAACQSAEVECLQKILSPFILRRLKNEVLGDLPKKINIVLRCEMPERQKEMYVNEVRTWQSELTRSLEKLTSELTGSPPAASSATDRRSSSTTALSSEPSSGGSAQGPDSTAGTAHTGSGEEEGRKAAQPSMLAGDSPEKSTSNVSEESSSVGQANESDGPSTGASAEGCPDGQMSHGGPTAGEKEASQVDDVKGTEKERLDSSTSAESGTKKGDTDKEHSGEAKENKKDDDIEMASPSALLDSSKASGEGRPSSKSVSSGSEHNASLPDPSTDGERTTDDVCMEGDGGGSGTTLVQPTASGATLASRKKFVNSLLFRLRRICNHPLLMQGAYTNEQLEELVHHFYLRVDGFKGNPRDKVEAELRKWSDYEIHQAIQQQISQGDTRLRHLLLPKELLIDSAKIRKLIEIVKEIKRKEEKALIFSQYTTFLDVIEECLTEFCGHIRKCRLDGSTAVEERQNLVDQFNSDPDFTLFLLSTKAGGQGLNLTAARTVILMDQDYNPQNDRQAEDRVHRLGQTRDVTVYRLCCRGTVEESILKCCQAKLDLDVAFGGNSDLLQAAILQDSLGALRTAAGASSSMAEEEGREKIA
ncbi:snf2 family [Cystoisospora suis]|uniref:Snf2 family n=1 Tax=Cystoisospora suis TaxID=483139 RepID=A0A2C6KLZ6_9APIC|nr:snf2 family [Cystoisospora suis]